MPDNFQTYTFSFSEIAPSLTDILTFLQSQDSEEDHPVRTTAIDLLNQLQFHTAISGGYIIKSIENLEVKQGILTIGGTEINTGPQICGYIKGSTEVALFICTAGDIFTTLSSEFNSEGQYLEAFIADAIGSLTVENTMDRIQGDLSDKMLLAGKSITNRYSPGYCNWPLSEQKKVFDLIGKNPTGITLTDSFLMQPIKSVSGIIGIGENVRKREYGCKICNNKNCIYRKIINNK